MFIQRLVHALVAGDVAYCIVGGVAVNLHGVPRMTYDIDIMVTMSHDNLHRCDTALRGLGMLIRLPIQLSDAADVEIAAEWEAARNLLAVTFTDPQNPLHEVDILVAPSLDPNGTVARAVTVGAGLRIASLEDLLRLKRKANRNQDIADIEHLERLAKKENL